MHGLNPTDISYLQSLNESDLAAALGTMEIQDQEVILESLKEVPPPLSQQDKKRKRDRDRINAKTATKNEIGQLPECVDPVTRQKCLDSLLFFLTHCFPAIFTDPFGEVQLASIAHEENVIRRGSGKLNKYEPRGYGKSTRSILSGVWGALNGYQDFTMICCDSMEKSQDLLKMALMALGENQIILGLFPEVWPFHKLTSSHACQYQTYQGNKTKIDTKGDTIYFPVLNGDYASEGCMIVSRPFRKARGKNIEGRRPSLVILDDIQSTEDALSPTAPRKLVKFLTTDIAFLGSRSRPVSIINNATIIADRDYPSMASELKAFTTVRYKMVNSFPDDYEKGEGHWREYLKIRQDYDEEVVGDDERAKRLALEYYQQHLDEMNAGESVTWKHAYSRVPEECEISTIQAAINFIQDFGRAAFDSECQNQALAAGEQNGLLTAKELAAKQHPYGELVIPPWCDLLTAYVDVQKDVLFFKIWGFQKDGFTGGNLKFGTFPKQKDRYFTKKTLKVTLADVYETTTLEARQKQALLDLTDDLCQHEFEREDGLKMQIDIIGIDSRYQTGVVRDAYRESKNKGRLQLCMGTGYGAKKKPQRHKVIKKRSGAAKGFGWFLNPAVQGIQTLEMDTNRLKSFVHQRYSTELGDPGSFSLYEADPLEHELNADHETAEFFTRLEGPHGLVDEWEVKPGRPDNDGFDCTVGCVAVASLKGAKMVGAEEREDGRIQKRKIDGRKWGKKQ